MVYFERLLFLTFMGLLITLTVSIYVILQDVALGPFLHALFFMFLLGFACRVLRRKIFFGTDHTLHQAFSFEALFQGANALNPQLPYPSVEQAFIRRQTGLKVPRIQNWFSIRLTSAFAIPLALLGAVVMLWGSIWGGALIWGFGLSVIFYSTLLLFRENHHVVQALRFTLAVAMGLLAVFLEAWCWLLAAHLLVAEAPSWQVLLLYFLTLTLFEVAPVPLGLGVIEIAFCILAVFFELPMLLIALPLAYRLARTVPIILIMLFYLPRYKLALSDLYDPNLEIALSKAWHMNRRADNIDVFKRLISIVIPAYNEALRLPSYLSEVIQFTRSLPNPVEIIVVDDGSTDGTGNYVRSLMTATPNLQLLVMPNNAGKGAAVRRGVLAAQGEYVLFTDADGSTPIGETVKLLTAAYEGGDVVIASRRLGESIEHRSLFRGLLGSVFYRLTNLMAIPGIADTQCGFKLFPRESARQLFSSLREDGWAFDVEMLYLAQKLGMTIVEVPVHWTAVKGSKIDPLHDALRMLGALMRIRKRWKGISSFGNESEGNI